jgi:hypothetical protein
MEVSSKETIIILHGTWTVLEPEKSRWCQPSDGSRAAEGFIAKLDAALQERGSCGFQKFDPGRIRTMKQNQGIISCDACRRSSARDVSRQPFQVAASGWKSRISFFDISSISP